MFAPSFVGNALFVVTFLGTEFDAGIDSRTDCSAWWIHYHSLFVICYYSSAGSLLETVGRGLPVYHLPHHGIPRAVGVELNGSGAAPVRPDHTPHRKKGCDVLFDLACHLLSLAVFLPTHVTGTVNLPHGR